MILNEIELSEVEKYAAQFFSYTEIAILIKKSIYDFTNAVTDNESDVYFAYQRGKLLSESNLREQIIKMAKLGSAIAQTEALKLINTQKLNELIYA